MTLEDRRQRAVDTEAMATSWVRPTGGEAGAARGMSPEVVTVRWTTRSLEVTGATEAHEAQGALGASTEGVTSFLAATSERQQDAAVLNHVKLFF